MIKSRQKKNTGVAGLADVRVLANSIRVLFKADGDQYDLQKGENGPAASGLYNITLEKTNDKIKWVSPPGRSQPYLVRFVEFGNRKNSLPEPKKDDGGPRSGTRQDGTAYSYYKPDTWNGVAKLEVMEDGIYNGLNITYRVPYIFVPDGLTASLEGTKGEIRKVEEFLRLHGFDFATDEIPFSTNILPWLETRLQAAEAYFMANLNEKGFVDALNPLPAFVDVSTLIGGGSKKKSAAKPKAKAAKKSKTR